MTRSLFAAVAALALALPAVARAQGDDALKDRVNQLVERLGAPKAETADAAEKALITLGAKALPLLPEVVAIKDAKQKARLEKVRAAIIESMEATNLGASIVTIKGQGIRLTEALKALQSQTGNAITDLREANNAEATNPSLDLDIDKKPFFEALDIIAKQANVIVSFGSGDGTIGLLPGGDGGSGDDEKPEAIGVDPPTKLKQPVQYVGPFRVEFRSISSQKILGSGVNPGNAQLEVAWEPRLRPMLLALKAEDVTIIDDRGKAVSASVTDESSSVVLRPENPSAEVNLNFDPPGRETKVVNLKSFKIKAEVTIPAGVKTFRFPNLTKPGVVKQGDVSVKLESTEVEESTWKVQVELTYPGGGPAFESYRQGLFNNRVWLQKADGSRFEHNGGFSNVGSDNGKLGFEYLFVDAPGKPTDYGFVYETPSKVVSIPLEFEYKDVPLP